MEIEEYKVESLCDKKLSVRLAHTHVLGQKLLDKVEDELVVEVVSANAHSLVGYED